MCHQRATPIIDDVRAVHVAEQSHQPLVRDGPSVELFLARFQREHERGLKSGLGRSARHLLKAHVELLLEGTAGDPPRDESHPGRDYEREGHEDEHEPIAQRYPHGTVSRLALLKKIGRGTCGATTT